MLDTLPVDISPSFPDSTGIGIDSYNVHHLHFALSYVVLSSSPPHPLLPCSLLSPMFYRQEAKSDPLSFDARLLYVFAVHPLFSIDPLADIRRLLLPARPALARVWCVQVAECRDRLRLAPNVQFCNVGQQPPLAS